MGPAIARSHDHHGIVAAVGDYETEDVGTYGTYGTVPAMIWPRILVFTSMMLRVLTPAAFGSYGAGIYIPKLGLVPKHVRPVRPVANLYDLLAS